MKLKDIKKDQEVTLRKGADATVFKVLGLSGVLVCIQEISEIEYAPQLIDYSLIYKITKQP